MTGSPARPRLRAAAPLHARSDVRIRSAGEDDVGAIRRIYAHHVLHGTGSFEEQPPAEAEMMSRLRTVLDRPLPYLVAETDGDGVAGFAYAGPFRPRSAYRFTVEDSVYVAPEAVGSGIGRHLLARLIADCGALGYRQMVAVIGDSANAASIRLHAGQGFIRTGTLERVGRKFDRWLDVVFMQRPLDPKNG